MKGGGSVVRASNPPSSVARDGEREREREACRLISSRHAITLCRNYRFANGSADTGSSNLCRAPFKTDNATCKFFGYDDISNAYNICKLLYQLVNEILTNLYFAQQIFKCCLLTSSLCNKLFFVIIKKYANSLDNISNEYI